MNDFNRSVFINCPFDDDYRQMLLSISFAVKYLGFLPRLSLEGFDSSVTRIDRVLDLIEACKFGIHDLSRITADAEGAISRMNMPFELGVDYGCKKFKGGQWSGKRILILEKERYRYQAALSDLSGSDIKDHNDEPIEAVKAVRDWFTIESLPKMAPPSYTDVWHAFNAFTTYLEGDLERGGHNPEDYNSIPIPEVMSYMDKWLKVRGIL